MKLIAYRAETALAAIVREESPERTTLAACCADLCCSEADLLPDLEQQKLRVSVHPMSNPRSNREIAHLLEQLNAAEFTYPGTKLQLVYSIAGEAETPNSVHNGIAQIRRRDSVTAFGKKSKGCSAIKSTSSSQLNYSG